MDKVHETGEVQVTGFQSLFTDEPHYTTLNKALLRIKNGASKDKILKIRNVSDKDRQDKLKVGLPIILFSGRFPKERTDSSIIEHSGFIVLDFDDEWDVAATKESLSNNKYVYAVWLSPTGNGLKALVRILDKKKHRQHFESLKKEFPDIDPSGINESRVCFESYDPDIYINRDAEVYSKIIETVVETVSVSDTADPSNEEKFRNILRWLENRHDAFVEGERNLFIFKLASACCRFGIDEDDTCSMISSTFGYDSSFTRSEAERTVRSAFKSNRHEAGTAVFSQEKLVDRRSKKEVILNAELYDKTVKPKDVVYGEYVKDRAISIYDNGFENIQGLGIPEIDELWKMKKQELTLFTGYGGFGKSTFLIWLLVMRAIKFGDKFAIWSPEINPSEEFYFELCEIILGCDMTPNNHKRADKAVFDATYDWVSQHFFYIYPEQLSPTPKFIKEKYLELVIKEGVTGCILDPLNSMTNNYDSYGGRDDKYLEVLLSDFIRFSQQNNTYFIYVAHPRNGQINQNTGNFDAPNQYSLSGGAMHANKAYNILAYHRPYAVTDPSNTECELHALKIRKRTVGKKGSLTFEHRYKNRRFFINGIDYLDKIISENIDKVPFLKSRASGGVQSSSEHTGSESNLSGLFNFIDSQTNLEIDYDDVPF